MTATVTDSAFGSFDVADYTDAVIRISGVWDGTLYFFANNTPTAPSSAIAVQDIDSTNWTTAVTTEAGSSPSTETQMYRVPVAGLTTLILALGPGASGSINATVTAVSNTNAR